ncbi:MAG: hypothetical protein PQJ58_01430 [Spirochaetales bacterium]|nr:hypothetical protein [Spirochaetales bacterium]
MGLKNSEWLAAQSIFQNLSSLGSATLSGFWRILLLVLCLGLVQESKKWAFKDLPKGVLLYLFYRALIRVVTILFSPERMMTENQGILNIVSPALKNLMLIALIPLIGGIVVIALLYRKTKVPGDRNPGDSYIRLSFLIQLVQMAGGLVIYMAYKGNRQGGGVLPSQGVMIVFGLIVTLVHIILLFWRLKNSPVSSLWIFSIFLPPLIMALGAFLLSHPVNLLLAKLGDMVMMGGINLGFLLFLTASLLPLGAPEEEQD